LKIVGAPSYQIEGVDPEDILEDVDEEEEDN